MRTSKTRANTKSRARRVKCDEGKPECRRCLKFGTTCLGYPRTSDRSTAPKSLLNIAPRKPSAPAVPLLSIQRTQFNNDREHRCFSLFCKRTMLDLVGSDDSDLWSKTVLQACEQEDSFCRAVIAIGGLDQALETSQAIGKKCPVGHMGIDEPLLGHYRFALQQYDEFLTRMRRRLTEGPYDLRHTLISCILVVCFELFQGNHSAALSHASTGLDLIKKTLGPDKMRNWNSTGLDASLIQIFLRLDQISLSSALQSLTRTYVNTSTEIGDMEADALPSEFATCKEARSYWKVTVRRVSHASSRTTTHDLISDGHPWKSTTSSKDAVSEWHSTRLTGGLESKSPVCPDSSIGYLRQWSAAFQPLLNASRRESGKSFRSKAAFLQLRHNTTLLALVGSQSDSELVYDNFVSLFQETLHLARDVLSEPSSGHNGRRPIFTFDIGVIGSLWSGFP